MNTTDNPQHNNPARPDPARLVPEPQERPEPGEATSTPEAVRAAQVARDDKEHALVRGRGVEWVRPTELIAREPRERPEPVERRARRRRCGPRRSPATTSSTRSFAGAAWSGCAPPT